MVDVTCLHRIQSQDNRGQATLEQNFGRFWRFFFPRDQWHRQILAGIRAKSRVASLVLRNFPSANQRV